MVWLGLYNDIVPKLCTARQHKRPRLRRVPFHPEATGIVCLQYGEARNARTVIVRSRKDFHTWEHTARGGSGPLIKQTTPNRAFVRTSMLSALVAHALWAACYVAVKVALTSAIALDTLSWYCPTWFWETWVSSLRSFVPLPSKRVSPFPFWDDRGTAVWNILKIEVFAGINIICKDWRLPFFWARRWTVQILGDWILHLQYRHVTKEFWSYVTSCH